MHYKDFGSFGVMNNWYLSFLVLLLDALLLLGETISYELLSYFKKYISAITLSSKCDELFEWELKFLLKM